MPRKIQETDETVILCSDKLDKQGLGNSYWIKSRVLERTLATLAFQTGPIKEAGVNGIQIEDLLAVCVDRLQCFQKGEFSCRANALALTKLEEALHWLESRTADRRKRGVEGQNKQ